MLEYDIEGRMLVFDSLAVNLPRFYGFISIGSSLGGLYLFNTTAATTTMTMNTLMHWGGISYFTLFSTVLLRHIL